MSRTSHRILFWSLAEKIQKKKKGESLTNAATMMTANPRKRTFSSFFCYISQDPLRSGPYQYFEGEVRLSHEGTPNIPLLSKGGTSVFNGLLSIPIQYTKECHRGKSESNSANKASFASNSTCFRVSTCYKRIRKSPIKHLQS